jgi:LPXTG-site transpeptidase (sortase) family protein
VTAAVPADPQDAPGRPSAGPVPPGSPVRAVARVAPVPTRTVRGRATVPGAINPVLRDAPPYVPPPKPVAARGVATPHSIHPIGVAALPHVPADGVDLPVEDAAPEAHAPAVTGADEAGKPIGDPDQSEPSAAPNPDVRLKPNRLKRLAKRAVLPVAAALIAAFVGATGYLIIKDPVGAGDIGRWTGDRAAAPVDSPLPEGQADPAPFAVPADGAANPFGTKAATLSGPPTRLKVEAIGLDTPLETLKLGSNGELIPPKSFPRAGWYADGTLPGDTGPAVIAGHVDSKRGPAVFYKLRELTKGDRIEVVRGGQTVRFTVTSTAWYPKNKFPTNEVYGPTPDRQLRLITCGGVFDRSLRSYKDNLVVYAVAG